MKRFLLILFCHIAVLTACNREADLRDSFSESEGVGLSVKGRKVFKYNALNCQSSFNRERCEFRLCTDNMSDFVRVRLSGIPAEKGQRLSADVSWTTSDNVDRKKDVGFEVIRCENDRFWLWSSSSRIGIVLRVLD